jgi:hypothetical protein
VHSTGNADHELEHEDRSAHQQPVQQEAEHRRRSQRDAVIFDPMKGRRPDMEIGLEDLFRRLERQADHPEERQQRKSRGENQNRVSGDPAREPPIWKAGDHE